MNPTESSSPNQPTRFVEHPGRRRAWRRGQRNLAWGVAFLFAALSLLGIALFISGARAMFPLVLCMLSFTALWVLARLKIFGQRNGVFFSLAIIALLGALSALLEAGWGRLANRSAEPRVATNAATSVTLSSPSHPEIPRLIEALHLEAPDPSLPRARATRDLLTSIGNDTFRIARGDTFLMADEKGGEVVISAGEFLARVPANGMEILAPSASAPTAGPVDDGKSALEKQINAQLTQKAQAEAARRYPALGRAGTPENKVFVDAVNDLKARKSDLLDDPEWPLELAQTLAKRLGWKESGVIEEEAPAVVDSKLAPGTKVLAEPSAPEPEPEPATAAPTIPPPPQAPDIPPPPRTPKQ